MRQQNYLLCWWSLSSSIVLYFYGCFSFSLLWHVGWRLIRSKLLLFLTHNEIHIRHKPNNLDDKNVARYTRMLAVCFSLCRFDSFYKNVRRGMVLIVNEIRAGFEWIGIIFIDRRLVCPITGISVRHCYYICIYY